MTGRLEGKVAFITGAARGQGRSHAIRLASEGADIIAVDICSDIPTVDYPGATADELAETVEAVERLDRRIVASVADVRDSAALGAAVDEGVAQLGRLDIVSANAGIATVAPGSLFFSDEAWQTMIDINLTGVYNTVRATAPHIIAGGRGGSIVLTSSTAGIKAFANNAHYVAAKHGVVGIMKTFAIELGPHSIRVNTLHPTQVDTMMIMNPTFYTLFTGDENATREDFAPVSQAMHVLPVPWVEAIDVSNALLFLASDESRYVTGLTLKVDAGATLA